MGLWDWVKQILGGAKPVPPQQALPPNWPAPTTGLAPAPPRPAPTSPRTLGAKQPAAPVKLSLAQLDAGAFAPLSDDEIRKRARSAGRSLWNAWFGRRDLIPPASDPRTQLIDAGMVGHGFITREELVEIHEVGAQMDLVRPDLALADAAARAAVAQSQEERKALKEKKKAEAAERKRQLAAKVAHRRATDIVFLGRGVSHGLADRRSDIEKLQRQGLPLLSTPADVASALGLEIKRLRWLAFHSE